MEPKRANGYRTERDPIGEKRVPLDVFQAGAGTSYNMNVNEVVANRALELLDRKRGDYEFINANDEVNKAQHCAQAGQLELNLMMPYVAYAVLESLEVMRNAVTTFD